MSDPHRGAYTPNSDAPLSFDARQPVRGGGQAPVTLLLSAAILVALVVGIFFVYRGGVRGADDAPQPVGTPVASIKDSVPAQADKADPASGLQIYKTEGAEAVETAPTFAPPPEAPQPRPVPQVIRTPIPAATPAVSGPTIAPAMQPNPAPLPVVVGKAPAPTAPAPPVVVAKTAPPPVARPAAPTQVATTVAGGAAAVQIGAFSSQALADSGFTEATRIAPGLAAGKGKSVQAIQSNGQTLYRTAFTGFESRAAAAAFCSALKAAGKSCFVR